MLAACLLLAPGGCDRGIGGKQAELLARAQAEELAQLRNQLEAAERIRPADSSAPSAPKSPDNPPPPSHEDLDATVWMRTSAEYRVLVKESYQRALQAVDLGLQDPNWSALPGQQTGTASPTGDRKLLPTAAILDIDETVLDNSRYQVECIRSAPYQFTDNAWNTWCLREEATPVPGAGEFVEGCRARGVTVRFLTNRDHSVRTATLNNLRRLGLTPADASAEAELLCKGDLPDWGSDKTSRREHVAASFRILVLVGDDLNDFLWAGDKASPEARMAAADGAASFWGSRWFLLPNANYGGWEKSVQQYRFPATRDEYLKLKLEAISDPE